MPKCINVTENCTDSNQKVFGWLPESVRTVAGNCTNSSQWKNLTTHCPVKMILKFWLQKYPVRFAQDLFADVESPRIDQELWCRVKNREKKFSECAWVSKALSNHDTIYTLHNELHVMFTRRKKYKSNSLSTWI
jgi:hypothetical protein